MAHVDKHNGRHAEYPVDPKLYRAWWDGCTQDVKDAILAVGQPWHDMCQRIHDCHMNGVPAFPQRV